MISNKRNAYIDILKTTAILSVIFCHLQLNIGNDNNVVWYIRCNNKIIDMMWYIFGYIFSNLSVPIFMLLTGANRFRNIDNEDINYKKLFKEIVKVIVLLIIFQIPFYVYKHVKYQDVLTIADFAKKIYSSNIEPIYWYFTGFHIAFLLSYPILKKFTLKATKTEYEYLFIMYAVLRLIVINISKYFFINTNIPFQIFSYVYIYPLFGDLICNKYGAGDINYKKIYLLVACGLIYFLTNDTYDKMNIYVAMLMLILFKKLSYKNNDFAFFKASKIYDAISLSAKHALLFYLLHPYILKIIFRVTDKIYPKSIMYLDYPVSILILLINFTCTYIIIKIYHNLRGIYEKTN